MIIQMAKLHGGPRGGRQTTLICRPEEPYRYMLFHAKTSGYVDVYRLSAMAAFLDDGRGEYKIAYSYIGARRGDTLPDVNEVWKPNK